MKRSKCAKNAAEVERLTEAVENLERVVAAQAKKIEELEDEAAADAHHYGMLTD
jgi:archaellum component FlaC